jgi:hypothetical protein
MTESQSHDSWVVLERTEGPAQAEILRGLLEGQGIPAMLSQESVARFGYSLTVGPLAEVEVLVPSRRLEDAKQVIKDYWLESFAAKQDLEILENEPPEDAEEETDKDEDQSEE